MLIEFFNSPLFIAIITFLVGTVAFIVYKKQKRDDKRDAASVILLEIESAEQQLQIINQIQSPGSLAENIYLMRNSSWEKYRYYFVRDFRRNEWDKITSFYDSCLQYDSAVTINKDFFGANVSYAQSQIARILADYADKYVADITEAKDQKDKDRIRAEYEDRKKLFIDAYGVGAQGGVNKFAPPYHYNPQKPVMDAQKILSTIDTNLSLTSIGQKLRVMSVNQNVLRRFISRIVCKKE